MADIKKDSSPATNETSDDAQVADAQPEAPAESKPPEAEASHAEPAAVHVVADDTLAHETGEPASNDVATLATMKKPNKLRLFLATKKGKVVAVLAGIIALVLLLLAIPPARYGILGLFIKKEVMLQVLDATTNKPVSEADVRVGIHTAKTDNTGSVTLKDLPVGNYGVLVKKKYYADAATTLDVPILSAPQKAEVKLTATGRQVPIRVVNKINGSPMQKATVKVLETTVLTDEKGEASLVLPADKATAKAIITLSDYLDSEANILITEEKEKNIFPMTPAGSLYFLSKLSGKINVVRANLDGGNAQVVVAGTGKEQDDQTVLLASRDWKHLALKARRDSDKAKLYLIDTATNKLSVIDEGDADFTPVGWYNEHFVYTVDRANVQFWQTKKYALKSFNAAQAKLTTIDETTAEGSSINDYAAEIFGQVYILDDQLIYVKDWAANYFSPARLGGKKLTLVTVKPSGQGKQAIKSVDEAEGVQASTALYAPNEVYVSIAAAGKTTFYEYEHGKLEEAKDVTAESFARPYPTYLFSPSGKKTFWHESRNGKSVLFVGDANGENSQEPAVLTDYKAYGWHGEDYLLVSKNGSELFIMPAITTGAQPLKVTDYHKPDVSFGGYGYGYGGL